MQNISKISLALVITLGGSMYAQAQTQKPAEPGDQTPTYRISVVSRTGRAVNYQHRSGSTKIDFKGTDLMPNATGEAKVDSKRGALGIAAEFANLEKPAAFGTEYLTYVLWAISPEGRSVNLGEVLLGGNHRSKLNVTTDLQAFALIVTAEPYYAVRRPSNVVVLENSIREDTRGTAQAVDAKYELIDRGGYLPTGYTLDPVILSSNLPLEFFEARNAVRIAEAAGAARYAAPSYDNTVQQMKKADVLASNAHRNNKSLIALSRQTVQTAEDAREISMKNIDAYRADSERGKAAAREADARNRADLESQRRRAAEDATVNALLQRDDANRKNADAQADTRQAKNAQADAEAAQANAEGAKASAQVGQALAEADAERNRTAAAASDQQLQQAVRDREELRAKLLQQFNVILETHDTARGLVVNMSDVLFDTGKFTLRPLAREKLAKISGIVLAYPTLHLAVEGNTDSVGTDQYNQTLSEKRAEGVRGYLTGQGVPESSTTATGFGKTRPIASNDTDSGRQQNRRVELVVSGEVIGTEVISLKVVPVADLQLTR
jgi:outer membrane protein OmpA-like peptidoglycan-associated protein